jgi:hypothetical protein
MEEITSLVIMFFVVENIFLLLRILYLTKDYFLAFTSFPSRPAPEEQGAGAGGMPSLGEWTPLSLRGLPLSPRGEGHCFSILLVREIK